MQHKNMVINNFDMAHAKKVNKSIDNFLQLKCPTFELTWYNIHCHKNHAHMPSIHLTE